MNRPLDPIRLAGQLLCLGSLITTVAANPILSTPSERPEQTLHGRVLARDSKSGAVTIAIQEQAYVVPLSASTPVERGGKKHRLRDIELGDELTIRLRVQESTAGEPELSVLMVSIQPSLAAGTSKGTDDGTESSWQRYRNPVKR